LQEVERALVKYRAGGHVEELLEALEPLRRALLSFLRPGAQENPSMTEAAYRLAERGLLSEEQAALLAELSRMKEMAHYDIYAEYSREQIAEMWARALALLRQLGRRGRAK